LHIRLILAGFLVSGLVAASAHASDLPVISASSAGLNEKSLGGLKVAIQRGDFPKTTSVLIVKDGKLAYEGYFGEGREERLSNTRSATKFLTTLALGAAIGDGAVRSEHMLAFPFLADLKPFENDTREKEAITLQDMLTMSSALACDDNDDSSPGNEDWMHQQPNWTRWGVDLPTMQGYVRDASGLGPWRYCTANAFLVGQIVQRATHTPVDLYTQTKILLPLGIDKWTWSYSPAHEAMMGGGVELRSRDLAKIAWMVVDQGRWRGRQIVSKAWIDAALTARRASRPDQNYGYFVFEGSYRTACGLQTVWYMAGNGGSQILMLRNLRAAIVITREAYNVRGTSAQTADMIQKYILPSLPCARA
jgi:CubicO group peptidase (beta-lactamase class C family)